MFLTDTVYNRNKSCSLSDIRNEGYNIALEAEQVWHNISMSMVKLEHTAIINEDYSLLNEGNDGILEKIKAFFKKLWEKIKEFFRKIWEKIKSIASKIKNFIFGNKDKNKKVEVNENAGKANEIKALADKEIKLLMAPSNAGELPEGSSGTNLPAVLDNDKKTTVTAGQAEKFAMDMIKVTEYIAKNFSEQQKNIENNVKKALAADDKERLEKLKRQQLKLQQKAAEILTKTAQISAKTVIQLKGGETNVKTDDDIHNQRQDDLNAAFTGFDKNSPEYKKYHEKWEKNASKHESFLPYGILDQF